MADIFSEPSSLSDVVLIVEHRRLYVNKTILALASDVFKKMFESDFKEKQEKEIPLPGKKYDDFLEFLLCFYPHSMKPVTYDNVDVVLPLANEYQADYIKRKSEEALLNYFEETPLTNETLVHIILLADKYTLKNALAKFVDDAACRSFDKLASVDEFKMITRETQSEIYKRTESKADRYVPL